MEKRTKYTGILIKNFVLSTSNEVCLDRPRIVDQQRKVTNFIKTGRFMSVFELRACFDNTMPLQIAKTGKIMLCIPAKIVTFRNTRGAARQRAQRRSGRTSRRPPTSLFFAFVSPILLMSIGNLINFPLCVGWTNILILLISWEPFDN